MYLPDMGEDGDRVFVLFAIKDKDSEMTTLTLSINDGEEESTAETIHQATLAGGALTVRFRAAWPSSSLANGSYTIENLAVVNIDAIMRQTSDCKEIADWGEYLQGLLPIVGSCYSPRELYVQTAAGVWKQLDHEVFPVDRGGTGVDNLAKGEMLYGSGGGNMEKLEAANENDSLLMFSDGAPAWKTADEAKNTIHLARGVESSYEGTGKEGAVKLPGKPLVVWIRSEITESNPIGGEETTNTEIIQLFPGMRNSSKCSFKQGNTTIQYNSVVSLEEDELRFSAESLGGAVGDVVHWNEAGKQYTWTAIY